jgi:antitoxin (DNA-binding transcriptional repressor) of toxin-antitoxin stability system
MQRAHAGERFLITRRGKPYVRLAPAAPTLPLAAAEAVPPDLSLQRSP